MATTIYLDHNATTPVAPEVLEAMNRAWRDAYGNPGSRHAQGRAARRTLEAARESIAAILDARPGEVVFTSGGTEASNLAILGFAEGRTGTIVLPPGEHPATEETVRHLEGRGFQRWTIPIDSSGRLIDAQLEAAPWERVVLVTALLAHNETGVVQDLSRLSAVSRERGLPLHVDAVQAAGKIDVSFRTLGAATMAIGAHKFRGPRGIGALLIREGVRLAPVAFGGHQEGDRRPGTECTALAAGMARALELWQAEREAISRRVTGLRDRLEQQLAARCGPVIVHGAGARRLPNTLNIAFPGCNGEAILVALDLAGVSASLGSACASGSSQPAPILVAMGCSPDVPKSSVRFSVGATTTDAEIDEAVERISGVIAKLRRA